MREAREHRMIPLKRRSSSRKKTEMTQFLSPKEKIEIETDEVIEDKEASPKRKAKRGMTMAGFLKLPAKSALSLFGEKGPNNQAAAPQNSQHRFPSIIIHENEGEEGQKEEESPSIAHIQEEEEIQKGKVASKKAIKQVLGNQFTSIGEIIAAHKKASRLVDRHGMDPVQEGKPAASKQLNENIKHMENFARFLNELANDEKDSIKITGAPVSKPQGPAEDQEEMLQKNFILKKAQGVSEEFNEASYLYMRKNKMKKDEKKKTLKLLGALGLSNKRSLMNQSVPDIELGENQNFSDFQAENPIKRKMNRNVSMDFGANLYSNQAKSRVRGRPEKIVLVPNAQYLNEFIEAYPENRSLKGVGLEEINSSNLEGLKSQKDKMLEKIKMVQTTRVHSRHRRFEWHPGLMQKRKSLGNSVSLEKTGRNTRRSSFELVSSSPKDIFQFKKEEFFIPKSPKNEGGRKESSHASTRSITGRKTSISFKN